MPRRKVITYNPKNTVVEIAGVTITDFGENDMISISRNEEANMPFVDCLGNVSKATNADQTGTLTLTQNSSSPFFGFLMDLAESEETFSVNIEDLNDHQPSITATDCFVVNTADITKGKEIEDVEFEIFLSYYTRA